MTSDCPLLEALTAKSLCLCLLINTDSSPRDGAAAGWPIHSPLTSQLSTRQWGAVACLADDPLQGMRRGSLGSWKQDLYIGLVWLYCFGSDGEMQDADNLWEWGSCEILHPGRQAVQYYCG